MTSDLDAIQQRVGDALRLADPVPNDAVADAKALFALGALAHLEEIIADLVHDSLSGSGPGGGVTLRGGGPLSLSFATDDIAVELDADPERDLVLGQLSPAKAATVTLEADDAVVAQTTTDDLGRFRLEGLDPDARSIVVRITADGATTVCSFDCG